jgi:hypothetical protein
MNWEFRVLIKGGMGGNNGIWRNFSTAAFIWGKFAKIELLPPQPPSPYSIPFLYYTLLTP